MIKEISTIIEPILKPAVIAIIAVIVIFGLYGIIKWIKKKE